MKIKKFNIIYFMFLILLSFSIYAQVDLKNSEDSENSFQITETTIEVQRDQTELEKQSIAKETNYRVKLEARRRLINEILIVYNSTFKLIYDLITGIFLIAILRLIKFMLIDFVGILLEKTIKMLDKRF